MSLSSYDGECLICKADAKVRLLDLRVMGSEDIPICANCEGELVTHILSLMRVAGESRKKAVMKRKEAEKR